MKQRDTFLAIIVLAIIGLVVASFAVVLLSPEPEYKVENTAETAVYNYLLALQLEDYERALRYIADDVANRPADAAEMEWDTRQNSWRFDNSNDSGLTITGSRVLGDSATVTIRKTWSTSPFLGDVAATEYTIRLKQESGMWKLIDGQTHWAAEWGNEND